jgi:hypothetical protein
LGQNRYIVNTRNQNFHTQTPFHQPTKEAFPWTGSLYAQLDVYRIKPSQTRRPKSETQETSHDSIPWYYLYNY